MTARHAICGRFKRCWAGFDGWDATLQPHSLSRRPL